MATRKYAVILLMIVLLLSCGVAKGQTPITIQNASFEDTTGSWDHNWCGGHWGAVSTVWTGTGAYGPTQFTVGGCSFSSLPVGSGSVQGTVGGGSTYIQDLGISAASDTTYVLSAYVGRRADGYNGNWIFTLLAGSTTLCTVTGNIGTITSGTWALESLTCATGSSVPPGNLTVSLGCSGTSNLQSNFDLVSLTYTNNSEQNLSTYSTQSIPTNSNIAATTMVASTSAMHVYAFGWSVDLTALGVGCIGNTTVKVNAIFTSPASSSPATEELGMITLASGGNGAVGFVANGMDLLAAKSGTAVKYSTSNYTAGAGCTTNPTYQITPSLVQLW